MLGGKESEMEKRNDDECVRYPNCAVHKAESFKTHNLCILLAYGHMHGHTKHPASSISMVKLYAPRNINISSNSEVIDPF